MDSDLLLLYLLSVLFGLVCTQTVERALPPAVSCFSMSILWAMFGIGGGITLPDFSPQQQVAFIGTGTSLNFCICLGKLCAEHFQTPQEEAPEERSPYLLTPSP